MAWEGKTKTLPNRSSNAPHHTTGRVLQVAKLHVKLAQMPSFMCMPLHVAYRAYLAQIPGIPDVASFLIKKAKSRKDVKISTIFSPIFYFSWYNK